MSYLESAKNQLEAILAKQSELYSEIKDAYDLEDEDYEDAESVENAIYGGDIDLEWYEFRDVSYLHDLLCSQEKLVRVLEFLESEDEKDIHKVRRVFQTLVSEARRIRKNREDDLKKAQEVISSMNEILDIYDAYSQK